MSDLAPASPSRETTVSQAAAARLAVWQRSLLDLTLRNRMLDMRPGKQLLPFVGADPVAVVAALGGEAGLTVGVAPGAPTAAEAASVARLFAAREEVELDAQLVHMARLARTQRDDAGVEVLWLAVGTLVWHERNDPTPRRAPVMFVPVALTRRHARERYQVVGRADEPRLNLTLLEKLRVEWGLAIEIPAVDQDDEYDVATVLAAMRAAVASQPAWALQDEVTLGVFSFAKFVMWTDLAQRAAAIAAAPVAQRLLDPGLGAALVAPPLASPHDLDAVAIAATYTPLDADSSQLAAVLAASEGASFVLQGPPGTGKSQTITNLIAHAMAQGKRVLFVSEKMAALEVVKRRLAQAGLGDFCLELHSNKAQKREVVGDLARVLERAWRPAGPAAGDDATLARLRDELNAYVAAISTPLPMGQSFQQVVVEIEGLAATAGTSKGFSVDPSHVASAEALATAQALVERFAQAMAMVAPVASHPWRDSALAAWLPSQRDKLDLALHGLAAVTETLGEIDELAASLVPGVRAATSADLAQLAALATLAAQAPAVKLECLLELGAAPPTSALATLVAGAALTMRPQHASDYVAMATRAMQLGSDLATRYDDALWELDVRGLKEAYARYASRHPLIRWFGLRRARRQLAVASRGSAGSYAQQQADLEAAHAVVRVRRTLSDAAPDAMRWFGATTLGAAAVAAAEAQVAWGHQLRAAFERLSVAASADREGSWRALCVAVAGDPTAWARLQTLTQTACDSLAQFEAVSGVSFATVAPGRLHESVVARLDAWREHSDALREWTAYQQAASQLAAAGLGELVTRCARGDETSGAALVAAWRRAALMVAAEAHLQATPVLAAFHGQLHHNRVSQFAGFDQAALGVAQARMIAKVAERVPRLDGAISDEGEVGVLLRESKKQRRHKPLRALFREMPNLLGRLKPCLLMSPLSVAQYLDPDAPKFDLVVFDEASQIPTSDAIGALARGNAAIVVGDSKQLPPTRFFADQSAAEEGREGDDGEELQELESILDECVAAQLPQRHLGWHYRSRHESLIDFSNRAYYDGRLQIFPAAANLAAHLGVRLVRTAGVYDRAGTRTNPHEAAAVVAAVVEHLTHPQRHHKSLAVVTFSRAQQQLVEDLLDAARRETPAIEPFFADTLPEPVIVKNLETIQGDERDVVMFSVGYGPDATGKVAMNFGPLNRQGGERRLNVAITRAREQLVVFTSLDPTALGDGGASRGVADLAAFLKYAEARTASTQVAVVPGNAIAAAIGQGLAARGFAVRYGVGCSAYKVDVAVVDPDDPANLVFGIETDGPVYQLAPTARDRDRLRAAVLGTMGWRLARVWSPDWLADPVRELTRLHTGLVNAIAAARAAKKMPPSAAPVVIAPPPLATPETTAASLGGAGDGALPPYRHAVLAKRKRESTWVYSGESSVALMQLMTAVIEREAPVHLDVLVARVADAIDMPRVTSKLTERVRGLVAGVGQFGQGDDAGFVWPKTGDVGARHVMPRPPSDGETSPRRAIEEISVAELAGAALHILHANVAMDRPALTKEMARLFGYPRPNERILGRLEQAVERAVATGALAAQGERVLVR